MIEKDEELQKLLRQWEEPAASSKLDARVWSAFRQSAPAPRRGWAGRLLPIAAGVLLIAVSAKFWIHGPESASVRRDVSIATTADAAGFQAVSNGTITVVSGGGKQ